MYFRIMLAFATITMLVSCKSAEVGIEDDAEIRNKTQPLNTSAAQAHAEKRTCA